MKIADTMRKGVMKTPLGDFRFSPHGFEANPSLEILSLEKLDEQWKAVAAEAVSSGNPSSF